MDVNASTVVQGVMVAVLVGVGRAVWSASISLAKLGTAFDAHTKMDEKFQGEIRDELKALRRERSH
jgi:hypothetical protein